MKLGQNQGLPRHTRLSARKGGIGGDVVTDFGDFGGRTDASQWRDIRNDIDQRGDDAVIKLGRDGVVLRDFEAEELSWRDFIFWDGSEKGHAGRLGRVATAATVVRALPGPR